MRIHGWHIDGFGVHHDLQVTDLPRGLTVVTGPNESGKSTLQHFLAGVLFGYPNKGRPDRHEPVNGGNYGGRLFVTDERGRAITIHRGAQKRSLRLATADGDLDPSELAELLGGASKDLFSSVFAVHLADLAELKALTADQVRERVFSAGIVGAGRTAEAALTELADHRDMLLRPSGRGSFLLKSLREDLTAARTRLAGARADAARLPQLLEQLAAVEAAADALRLDARTIDQERLLLHAVQQVWPAWEEAAAARAALTELGPVPDWDRQAVATLRHALARRAERSAALAEATRKREDAVHQQAALPAPGPAAAHAEAIERLAQQAQAEAERRDRIGELRHRLAGNEADVDAALARLGAGYDRTWLASNAPRIDDGAELRTLASRTDEARRAAAAAVSARRTLAGELADQATELHDAAEAAARAAGPSADSAARYLDATARLVALVGQRETAARHLVVASQRAEAIAAATPTPRRSGRPVAAVGAAVLVVATALVAAGLTVPGLVVAALAVGLVATGAALGLGPAAATPTATAVAPDPLAAHAADELARLDAELDPVLATLDLSERPTASQAAEVQSLAHRLAREAHDREAAKRQTAELADAQRRAATRRLAAADAEVARARSEADDAEHCWTAWLAQHGLPAQLDPAGAAEFLATVDRARTGAQAAAQIEGDLRAAEAASDAFAHDVRALAGDLGFDLDQDPLLLADGLALQARVAISQAQALEAAAAHTEHRTADRNQAIAALDAADADLKTLLGEAAVADADDLLTQIDRVEHARKLQAVITEADTRLGAALGGSAHPIAQAQALLGAPDADPTRWAARADLLDREADEAHQRRDDAIDHRSRLQAEVDALTRSADIPTLELDVSNLETQLVEAVTQWASYHLAHQVVEGTLARYQRERQPEVVQRAARLFEQVTGGQYTRLEVRGTEVIAVNRAAVEVPASGLSQGTTEQLYLCMRFALAESFSKTAPLPLLLDDITVNADAERLPRLAQMIATVAEDHQVLVFSCQDRMVELLQQADPQARVIHLPGPAAGSARIGAVS